MYLLALGLIFVLCKWQAIGPIALWSWWVVLAPLGLAVVWWTWADASGYTKMQEEKKMERRKQARINRQKDALGIPKSGRR